MKIGDLATRSGLAASAIRFYESSGLLPPASRGPNGYRVYDEASVQRLLLIQTAQRLGFSLESLRSLIPAQGEGLPHDQILQSMQARLAEIDAMQTVLTAQRLELESLMQDLNAEWQEGRCLQIASAVAPPDPVAGATRRVRQRGR